MGRIDRREREERGVGVENRQEGKGGEGSECGE